MNAHFALIVKAIRFITKNPMSIGLLVFSAYLSLKELLRRRRRSWHKPLSGRLKASRSGKKFGQGEIKMRITQTKNGDFVLETNMPVETLTDRTGTTSFVYLNKFWLEKLQNEAWTALFDAEIRERDHA